MTRLRFKTRFLPAAWGNLANLSVIAIFVLPLLALVTGALQSERDLFAHSESLLPTHITFDNIVHLALGHQGSDLPEQVRFYPRAFLNSAIISLSVTLIVTILGSLSAYSIVRLRFPGQSTMPYGILGVRMVPLIALIIPLYMMMARLQLLGTPLAIIIPQAGLFLPYTIWILINYFASLPSELEDAARIDGCSRFGAFLRIVLPLSAPGLSANAVIIFLLWHRGARGPRASSPRSMMRQGRAKDAITSFVGEHDYGEHSRHGASGGYNCGYGISGR